MNLNGSVSQLESLSVCGIRFTSSGRAFGSGGGGGSLEVPAGVGCEWTVTSNQPWIHVTAGGSGKGNGVVTYTVDPNPSTSPRTGTLTLADVGQVFTITQSGSTGPCIETEPLTGRPGISLCAPVRSMRRPLNPAGERQSLRVGPGSDNADSVTPRTR